MRAFFLAYHEISRTAVRELETTDSKGEKSTSKQNLAQPVRDLLAAEPPPALAALPWGHNVLLVERLKKTEHRLWYAAKAVENGWSRAILVHQIESGLHRRQGQALTNFDRVLPPAQKAWRPEIRTVHGGATCATLTPWRRWRRRAGARPSTPPTASRRSPSSAIRRSPARSGSAPSCCAIPR